jgi:metal-responsive CopG/Arc/MetJ family transcriptional regulator
MANKKKDKPLVRVTVSLDPEIYGSFEDIAEQEERSTASLIRKAMKDYLENENKISGRDWKR